MDPISAFGRTVGWGRHTTVRIPQFVCDCVLGRQVGGFSLEVGILEAILPCHPPTGPLESPVIAP